MGVMDLQNIFQKKQTMNLVIAQMENIFMLKVLDLDEQGIVNIS